MYFNKVIKKSQSTSLSWISSSTKCVTLVKAGSDWSHCTKTPVVTYRMEPPWLFGIILYGKKMIILI